MKKVVSKAVPVVLLVSLMAGPLLMSARPAHASKGRSILIGVAVVGVVYYLVKGHKHKSLAKAPEINSRFFAQSAPVREMPVALATP